MKKENMKKRKITLNKRTVSLLNQNYVTFMQGGTANLTDSSPLKGCPSTDPVCVQNTNKDLTCTVSTNIKTCPTHLY